MILMKNNARLMKNKFSNINTKRNLDKQERYQRQGTEGKGHRLRSHCGGGGGGNHEAGATSRTTQERERKTEAMR